MPLRLLTLLYLTVWLALPSRAAEGLFRVEQRDGRWLMRDPQGKPFRLRGANNPGGRTGLIGVQTDTPILEGIGIVKRLNAWITPQKFIAR